jgi:hypothetical protein
MLGETFQYPKQFILKSIVEFKQKIKLLLLDKGF